MGDVLHLNASGRERKQKHEDVARDKARAKIIRWLKEVEAKVRARELSNLDARFARAVTNFPSANEGRCWPGQLILAGTLGKSDRTIRRCIARLGVAGLLSRKQRGWNKSNCYTFQINGVPLFPSRTEMSACDRTEMSACPSRTKMSDYRTLESLEKIESSSPSRLRDSVPRTKRPADKRTLPISAIIDLLVLRLGNGDQDAGWAVYSKLTDDVRVDLRNREREGTLDDELIESMRGTQAAAAMCGSVRRTSPNQTSEGPVRYEPNQVVHNRIVERLGQGDVRKGWLLLGALADSDVEFLTSRERAGELTDDMLHAFRVRAKGSMP